MKKHRKVDGVYHVYNLATKRPRELKLISNDCYDNVKSYNCYLTITFDKINQLFDFLVVLILMKTKNI